MRKAISFRPTIIAKPAPRSARSARRSIWGNSMALPPPPPLGAKALPDGSYDGQVVAVTGGGTGLGKGMAVEFARLGAKTALPSRQPHQTGPAAWREKGGQ